MELGLHKTNQASSAGIFRDYSKKINICFRFIEPKLFFVVHTIAVSLGGR
jgi:hypothetical protein